jgi:hypothetical protein
MEVQKVGFGLLFWTFGWHKKLYFITISFNFSYSQRNPAVLLIEKKPFGKNIIAR